MTSKLGTRFLLKLSWAFPLAAIILLPIFLKFLPPGMTQSVLLAITLVLPFLAIAAAFLVIRRQKVIKFSKKLIPLYVGTFVSAVFCVLVVIGIYKGLTQSGPADSADSIPLDAETFAVIASKNLQPPKQLKENWWLERISHNKNTVTTDVRNRAKAANQLSMDEIKALANPKAACVGAKNFLESGVALTYRYFDKENKEVFQYSVNSSFCTKNGLY